MLEDSKKIGGTKDRFIFSLIVIGLVALVMRITIGEALKPIPHHGGMTHTYFTYADNLIHHGVYSRDPGPHPKPDSLRMPLYSLFLAGIELLSGPDEWENWVTAIQYLLGAFTCVLIAMFGTEMGGTRVGTIAGIIAAFYVDYYYIAIVYLRETLSLFMLLLFLYCYLKLLKQERIGWAYGAAFFYGLGILIRPETLLIGFLLTVFFLREHVKIFKPRLAAFALVLVLALTPWSLWIVRNWNVHKHFLPFSTDGAWGLYMGQVFHPDEAYTVADPAAMRMIDATPVEWDWNQQMNTAARTAFREHPTRNIYWAWIKLQQTYQEFTNNGTGLFFPCIWLALFIATFRKHPNRVLGITLGVAAFFLHLMYGDWNARTPISLLQTKFRDTALIGAIGFVVLIFQSKDGLWKILAASLLTQVFSVVVYIAHLRSRLVLSDWILIIGVAYALVDLCPRLEAFFHHISFGEKAQNIKKRLNDNFA